MQAGTTQHGFPYRGRPASAACDPTHQVGREHPGRAIGDVRPGCSVLGSSTLGRDRLGNDEPNLDVNQMAQSANAVYDVDLADEGGFAALYRIRLKRGRTVGNPVHHVGWERGIAPSKPTSPSLLLVLTVLTTALRDLLTTRWIKWRQ
jgi:hypothetical protein